MTQAVVAPDTSAAELKIVNAVRTIIAKATPAEQPRRARPAVMHFQWTGGGAAIVLANCDPVLNEVPYPCRVVWAHLYAGDAAGNPVAVTASVDVQMTSVLSFGASTPLHGTGTRPTLTADSATNCSLTGWETNLITTDALIGRLASFTGSATWLVLTLLLRPTDVPIGVSGLIDGAGNTIIDNAGNRVVTRD